MGTIQCNQFRKNGCSLSFYFKKDDNMVELLEEVLVHINEIHDPKFVAKCKDDLLIEYGREIKMIRSHFDAMLD